MNGESQIMNIDFCPLSGSSIVKDCSFVYEIFILSTPQRAPPQLTPVRRPGTQRLND